MEINLDELRLAAGVFIESTEGHLKICRQHYAKLATAHDYFQTQLKDVREVANSLARLPPALSKFKGVSQDFTAAINRASTVYRSLVENTETLKPIVPAWSD